MLGGTLYLVGFENGLEIPDPEPCCICERMIKNAGIKRIVTICETKDEITTNIMDKSSTLKEAMASAIESICEDVIRTSDEEENTKRANAIKSLSEAYYIITGVNQNDKN